jgi:hypothetical protein
MHETDSKSQEKEVVVDDIVGNVCKVCDRMFFMRAQVLKHHKKLLEHKSVLDQE